MLGLDASSVKTGFVAAPSRILTDRRETVTHRDGISSFPPALFRRPADALAELVDPEPCRTSGSLRANQWPVQGGLISTPPMLNRAVDRKSPDAMRTTVVHVPRLFPALLLDLHCLQIV